MLTGKNAVITGANRGIGRATVEVFAKNGANIWACARKQDNMFEQDMTQIAEKHGVSIWPIYFDITNEVQTKLAVQSIHKTKLSIDILVNIAGVADESTSFTMTSMEKMKHVFAVNFFGITSLTQYVSRMMIRQKCGSIVNIASVAGIDGTPAQYEYAGSKAALIGGTKELARELSQFNIRVNAIAPGIVETNMGSQIGADLKEATLARITMNRMGRPEEIANAIAFVSSDLASYITGQIIRVDGGM